jgi:hypothetical protein
VYPENVEATSYPAVGIDWTTVRHDDPLGPIVPTTDPAQYFSINKLWDSWANAAAARCGLVNTRME